VLPSLRDILAARCRSVVNSMSDCSGSLTCISRTARLLRIKAFPCAESYPLNNSPGAPEGMDQVVAELGQCAQRLESEINADYGMNLNEAEVSLLPTNRNKCEHVSPMAGFAAAWAVSAGLGLIVYAFTVNRSSAR
jgi:hypothetical protein